MTVLGIEPHLDLTGLDIDVHLPVPIHLAARRRASHLQQPGGIAGARTLTERSSFSELKPGVLNAPYGAGREHRDYLGRREAELPAARDVHYRTGQEIPGKIAGSTQPGSLESSSSL